jgi:two-component system response regulator YesN
MNLIEFLNGFRIQMAKALIDNTDLKIGDIAKMTGFGNVTYFGRLFRKHFRLSASEYKQIATGNREMRV